jgi:hypothetical protein
MELNPWYIYPDLYEPSWDQDTQNLVWNESSTTTVLYLPSLIKTVSEAERLLTRSYRSEFESIGCCHWHVREW